MIVKPDPWLASLFSYDVFQIIESVQDPVINIDDIIEGSETQNIFCSVKIPVMRPDIGYALTSSGFIVVDVNVTFECNPKEIQYDLVSGLDVRPALQKDRDIVLTIAETCFTYSRFHLDPYISNELANTIKREWIANYFAGVRGEELLVAEWNKKIVGFLAVMKMKSEKKIVRAIDLIGIMPEIQRKGVGRMLVNYFINDSVGNCDVLRVGTQIANIPSMNLYQMCGFHIIESHYVLHSHIHQGKVLS